MKRKDERDSEKKRKKEKMKEAKKRKWKEADKQAIEISKRHQIIEKEKGFVPPPPLLIPEIAKLFDIISRLTLPDEKRMSYTRRSVFHFLERKESASQQDVVKFAHISAPSVSTELACMEKEGLILRERDDRDKRMMKISLTKKGKQNITELKKSDQLIASVIMENISSDDEKTLSALLIGVRNRLLLALEQKIE